PPSPGRAKYLRLDTTSEGGDFQMATSGDLHLATSGDFFMATDIRAFKWNLCKVPAPPSKFELTRGS
ncbi:MAG: hypothetical protein ACT4P1_12995, partial [Sporichthyaceae bacterium]